VAKEKKKTGGHPRFKLAISRLIFSIREDLKADDLVELEKDAGTLEKLVKEEKAYRNREAPTIERMGRPVDR